MLGASVSSGAAISVAVAGTVGRAATAVEISVVVDLVVVWQPEPASRIKIREINTKRKDRKGELTNVRLNMLIKPYV